MLATAACGEAEVASPSGFRAHHASVGGHHGPTIHKYDVCQLHFQNQAIQRANHHYRDDRPLWPAARKERPNRSP